jgi:hypothetical protein
MSTPPRSTGSWQLERHGDGRIDFVTAEGIRHEDVDIRRGFPFSAPREGVAVISAAGRELVWVDAIDSAEQPSRALIERVLAEREFMPVISRIQSVSEGRPAEWSVETDRGLHRFSIAHPDDVSRQADGSMILTDTDGIRYRIPMASARDPRNRRLLDRAL